MGWSWTKLFGRCSAETHAASHLRFDKISRIATSFIFWKKQTNIVDVLFDVM